MKLYSLVKHVSLLLLLGALAPLAVAKDFIKHDDIVWANAGERALKLDIYQPEDAQQAPVVVIYHGGGWLVNDESVMDSMSAYLAEHGGYVVANVNYRLLPDNGNTTKMNEIVEDVFGGLLWVKAHIAEYGGDPARIAVTGDSAGGHLASMILTRGRQLETDGFAGDSLGFNPTWLPEGQTAEQVARDDGLAVQAAVISYGAFNLLAAAQGDFETAGNMFWQWSGAEPRGMFGADINVIDSPDYYRAVSPLFNIPPASEYQLPPQFHHVGSLDTTTPPTAVKAYVDELKVAGQPASLKIYQGNNHAYMDTGCIEALGSCFDTHAVPVLQDILAFLDKTL